MIYSPHYACLVFAMQRIKYDHYIYFAVKESRKTCIYGRLPYSRIITWCNYYGIKTNLYRPNDFVSLPNC
jgi:hypothetical protein